MTTAGNNDSAGGQWRSKRNRRPRHRRYGVRIGDSPNKKTSACLPTGGKQAEKNRSKALIVRQSAAGCSQLSAVLILDGDAVSKTRNLYPQIVIQRYFFT